MSKDPSPWQHMLLLALLSLSRLTVLPGIKIPELEI